MTPVSRRDALAMLGALVLPGIAAGPARGAAAWPAKPVTMLLPSSPGGGSDVLLRLLASKLQEKWKQPVVVEYKPGANTVIATDMIARAPADGYMLGAALTSYMINPPLQPNLPYDPMRDLVGVSLLATSDFGMFAHPSLEVDNVADLIAYAKKHPGKLSYATGGIGSGSHLAWELFHSMAGTDMVHVPYSGGGPAALVDVVAGRVPLLIDVAFGVMPTVRQKRLKALALTGPKRSAQYPGVAPIAETLPGFSVLSYMGIIAASGLPSDLRHRISSDIQEAVRSPDMRARMLELGMDPVGSTAEEYDRVIRQQIGMWSEVIRTAGIKVQ